jgi:hypothetical protein
MQGNLGGYAVNAFVIIPCVFVIFSVCFRAQKKNRTLEISAIIYAHAQISFERRTFEVFLFQKQLNECFFLTRLRLCLYEFNIISRLCEVYNASLFHGCPTKLDLKL